MSTHLIFLFDYCHWVTRLRLSNENDIQKNLINLYVLGILPDALRTLSILGDKYFPDVLSVYVLIYDTLRLAFHERYLVL